MNSNIKKQIISDFIEKFGDMLYQGNRTVVEFIERDRILSIYLTFDEKTYAVAIDTGASDWKEYSDKQLLYLWFEVMD